MELRNEAIACLALPDLRLSRELEIRPGFGGWVVFDSNSERYACGDERGNISVLAVADNRELAFLPGFGSNVHAMYFSPDKRLLAVSYTRSDSIELRIWDLAQEKIVSIPPVQNFRNLALSPDSRLAAIAQDHGPILIYDLTLDRTARSFPQESPVNGVAFHPTGRTLAVCRMGTPVVQLLDLETGTTVRSFTNSDVVFCLAWNTDGSSLAAGGKDGRIRIWDADTGRMRCTLMGHQSAVIHLSFNHTGDILVSTSWDGRLRLCNAITGAEIFNREIYAGGASLCPDDSWLVCQTAERKIGIFEMTSGDECRLLAFDEMAASEPWCCVFDPDGQVLVTAHRAGLRFWNVRNGLPIGFQSIGETHSAFFDSAGKRLVTNGAGGLRRWPMEFPPGDRTGNFKVGAAEDLGWQTDLDQITSMDREAKVLAAVRDGKACVFDLKTRTEKSRFAGEMPFEFATISDDAKWCAASQWKAKSVRVFDMATGNRIADLPADKVYVAVFSPDNQWLVTGGYEEYCFWNTASWQMSCRLRRARPGYIRPAISFALDSRMAAVADAQKVLLLDPATGRQFASLESREPANVSAIGFNPDGTRLAVCGWNHLIQLWDLRLIRQELAAINLDWELPPYPAPAAQQNSN